jgi:hypothetical protein
VIYNLTARQRSLVVSENREPRGIFGREDGENIIIRGATIPSFRKYHSCGQIKKAEMGGTFSTNRNDEN